jgi:hypothetical protein
MPHLNLLRLLTAVAAPCRRVDLVDDGGSGGLEGLDRLDRLELPAPAGYSWVSLYLDGSPIRVVVPHGADTLREIMAASQSSPSPTSDFVDGLWASTTC